MAKLCWVNNRGEFFFYYLYGHICAPKNYKWSKMNNKNQRNSHLTKQKHTFHRTVKHTYMTGKQYIHTYKHTHKHTCLLSRLSVALKDCALFAVLVDLTRDRLLAEAMAPRLTKELVTRWLPCLFQPCSAEPLLPAVTYLTGIH